MGLGPALGLSRIWSGAHVSCSLDSLRGVVLGEGVYRAVL